MCDDVDVPSVWHKCLFLPSVQVFGTISSNAKSDIFVVVFFFQ